MQGHLAEGRASGTTYSPNGGEKSVTLRSKEGSLSHNVPNPPSKASRLSGDSDKKLQSSPLGGFGPIWYLLDLLKLSQKANPCVSLASFKQSFFPGPMQPLSGRNRSSFLSTRTPAVKGTLGLSETKVRPAVHPRHLHPGSQVP